jgi:hypothetical protein
MKDLRDFTFALILAIAPTVAPIVAAHVIKTSRKRKKRDGAAPPSSDSLASFIARRS